MAAGPDRPGAAVATYGRTNPTIRQIGAAVSASVTQPDDCNDCTASGIALQPLQGHGVGGSPPRSVRGFRFWWSPCEARQGPVVDDLFHDEGGCQSLDAGECGEVVVFQALVSGEVGGEDA